MTAHADTAAETRMGTDVSEPVIAVEDLTTHFGQERILSDVNLDVRPREIMVIMGASGSGKSTLLYHLLGLLSPTSGTARILGRDIATIGQAELTRLRCRMGVAFQGGALFSSMTVGENIMLPLQEHTDLDETTMRIMARMKIEVVNLAGAEALMPSQLSGGMAKRAALARAIAMDPTILFCDEPSAGLDPIVAAAIDQLILDLRAAFGMTVVAVTHELESAFAIADRICVIDGGEVVIVDTVESVRACADQRVQDLLNRRVQVPEVDPDAIMRV